MIDPSNTDVVRRRILASLIDLAIVVGLSALVARIVAVTFIVTERTDEGARFGTVEDYDRYESLSSGLSRLQEFGDTWYVWDIWRLLLIGAIAVLLILLIWVVLPSRTDQSPGKAVFGLRTTDLLGETAATSQHVTRTIFGLVDILPVVAPGLLGWVFAATSHHRQRLGDRLAQTVVIDARAPRSIAATPKQQVTVEQERTEAAERLVAPPATDVATPEPAPTEPVAAPREPVPAEPAPVEPVPAEPAVPETVPTIEATLPVADGDLDEAPSAAVVDPASADLFDDNAPIDIERPADDLPIRRSTLRAEHTHDDSHDNPTHNVPNDAVLGDLLAADNHADLGRGGQRDETERLQRAAWERPAAEPAPVWRPGAEARPLIGASNDAGRGTVSGEDYVEWSEIVVPEPVSLDFDDTPIVIDPPAASSAAPTQHAGRGTTAGESAGLATEPDEGFSVDRVLAEAGLAEGSPDAPPVGEVTPTETTPTETTPTETTPTETMADDEPMVDRANRTVIAQPAPVVSEPAPEVTGAPSSGEDPRTPTWSDAWQAWVMFDPARNAWLRHDPEQDLWLEL